MKLISIIIFVLFLGCSEDKITTPVETICDCKAYTYVKRKHLVTGAGHDWRHNGGVRDYSNDCKDDEKEIPGHEGTIGNEQIWIKEVVKCN